MGGGPISNHTYKSTNYSGYYNQLQWIYKIHPPMQATEHQLQGCTKAFLGSPGSFSRIEGTGHWRHRCQRCEEWWGGGVWWCMLWPRWGHIWRGLSYWENSLYISYQLNLGFGFVPPGLVVACLPDQFAPKLFSPPLLVKTNSHI